jgi:pimeloyl-CoA dehydrogenase
MCALVRTSQDSRKQDGITMLLFDMGSPGVTVRPIRTIDGAHHVNEVFLDNVAVPVANRVGEEGQGWDCAKFLLANERVQVAKIGLYRERLDYLREVLELAPQAPRTRERIEQDLVVLDAEVRALEVLQWRLAGMSGSDPRGPVYASVLKLGGSAIQQKLAEMLFRLCGTASLELMTADAGEHFASEAGPTYLYARAATIFGGSSEIQKEILGRALF